MSLSSVSCKSYNRREEGAHIYIIIRVATLKKTSRRGKLLQSDPNTLPKQAPKVTLATTAFVGVLIRGSSSVKHTLRQTLLRLGYRGSCLVPEHQCKYCARARSDILYISIVVTAALL